jgi:hypothetical protein
MLRDILKDLSSKHSYVDLHKELVSLMKEEYEALKNFFTVEEPKPRAKRGSRKVVPEAEAEAEVTPEEVLPLPENHKVIANTRIRIIKKSEDGSPPTAPPTTAAPAAAPTPAAAQTPAAAPMTSKDLKAWQKEQEAKKLAELTAQGIVPETLLTAQNIKKWIEDEHRTFAYVAREYVGMPEAKVADFAKEHGINSTISKKRAILSAKNRKL